MSTGLQPAGPCIFDYNHCGLVKPDAFGKHCDRPGSRLQLMTDSREEWKKSLVGGGINVRPAIKKENMDGWINRDFLPIGGGSLLLI